MKFSTVITIIVLIIVAIVVAKMAMPGSDLWKNFQEFINGTVGAVNERNVIDTLPECKIARWNDFKTKYPAEAAAVESGEPNQYWEMTKLSNPCERKYGL